ncbi:hypothetical protein [Planctomycetes bacterium Poly30]
MSGAALPLFGSLLLPAATALPAQDSREEVLEECDEWLKRNPPRYHIRAYEALAALGDLRALEILKKHYAKPGFPRGQTPFLIASAVGEKGVVTGIGPEMLEWMEDSDEANDAWLWKNILAIQIKAEGPERALEIARNGKEIALRGAAIEALAERKDESLYELIPELCKALPKKDAEKMILMGAMVSAMSELGNKKTQVKGEWQQVALSLIATMENEQTPRAAQLMLARHLASELEADRLVLEPDAWRALIAAKSRAGEGQEEKEEGRRRRGVGIRVAEVLRRGRHGRSCLLPHRPVGLDGGPHPR